MKSIYLTIFLLGNFLLPQCANAQPKISWEQAKQISTEFVEQYGIFEKGNYLVEENIYGDAWKKSVLKPSLINDPVQGPKLRGKSYYVLLFKEKSKNPIIDGTMWVFVDDHTGEVLTLIKYLPDKKTWK